MGMDRVRIQKVPRKLELETAPKSSRGTKRVGMGTEVGNRKGGKGSVNLPGCHVAGLTGGGGADAECHPWSPLF